MFIIIFAIVSESIKGEDHLAHSDWRKNTSNQSFPKYWISYVHKLTHNLIDRWMSKLFVFGFQHLKQKSMYFHLCQKRKKHTNLITDQGRHFIRSRTEVKPTVIMKLSVPKHYLQLGVIGGSHTINFSLHRKLKLNITFIAIDLQVIYKNCKLDSVSVINILSRNYKTNFDYCGLHSYFSLFPSSHHVKFVVFLRHLERRLPVEIHTSFSVISTGIIESFKISAMIPIETIAIFGIKIQNLVLYIFKIQVEKYQSIKLKLHRSTKYDSHFVLFSGPGYSSPVEQIYNSRTKHVEKFICLLQFFAYQEVTNTESYIEFTGVLLPVTEIEITHKSEPVVTYPDTGHGNKILKLQTFVPAYLNLTIMSFVYQGPTSFDCIYAGMIIHEFQLNEFQESFSLCQKYTSNHFNDIFHRSIYSTNSTFLIVFYHHEEYSSLSVQLKASHSYCRGVKINACEILAGGFKVLEVNQFLSLENHIFNVIHLLLFTKSCITLQLYVDPSVATEYSNPTCSFYFILSRKQPEEQFWKYILQGYLQGVHDRSIVLMTYGDDYNKTVNVRNITEVNQKQRCKKTADWFQTYCNYQSDKGLLLDAIYFVRTPAHKNTATFKVFLYRWSHSWINVVIQWAGKIMESKIRTTLRDQYYKPHLVFKEEAVLLTKIISSEELQVTVSASSNLTFHTLQWSQRLKVGKDKSSNKLTVALQGKLVYVNVQSNKNSSLVLEYNWMYEKLQGKITGQEGIMFMCNGKHLDAEFPSMFSKRIFHIVRQTKTKNYHFFKNYTIPCHNTQRLYSCVAICNAEQLSWRQASDICNQTGLYLPQLLSREEQEELLYLLKVDKHLYIMEAIYIGLKREDNYR